MISHELQIKNLQVHILNVLADYQESPIFHYNAMNLVVALLDNNNGDEDKIDGVIDNLLLENKLTPAECFEVIFTKYVEVLPC